MSGGSLPLIRGHERSDRRDSGRHIPDDMAPRSTIRHPSHTVALNHRWGQQTGCGDASPNPDNSILASASPCRSLARLRASLPDPHPASLPGNYLPVACRGRHSQYRWAEAKLVRPWGAAGEGRGVGATVSAPGADIDARSGPRIRGLESRAPFSVGLFFFFLFFRALAGCAMRTTGVYAARSWALFQWHGTPPSRPSFRGSVGSRRTVPRLVGAPGWSGGSDEFASGALNSGLRSNSGDIACRVCPRVVYCRDVVFVGGARWGERVALGSPIAAPQGCRREAGGGVCLLGYLRCLCSAVELHG